MALAEIAGGMRRYGPYVAVPVTVIFAFWLYASYESQAQRARAIPTKIPPTPTHLPTRTPIPSPSPTQTGEEGWDCATIGPAIPSAFQAIKKAGNPAIWENPPYLYIDGAGVRKVVDNWTVLGTVFNGDRVCVEAKPQSQLPHNRTLFRVAQRRQEAISARVRAQFTHLR